MPSGGSHFHGEPAQSLTPDVNQVRLVRALVGDGGEWWLGPRLPAPEAVNQARKRRCSADPVTSYDSRLPSASGRNDDRRLGDGVNKGDHPGDRANRAVEPELADERHPLDMDRKQHLASDEQSNGHREIQAGAALAHS